jgi:hypothetical protein
MFLGEFMAVVRLWEGLADERSRLPGIGRSVDVVRIGGSEPGDVDGRGLIPRHREMRSIRRFGIETARSQCL